jgi:hypothetical protein
LREEVEALAAQMAGNIQAMEALKDLPDKVGQLFNLLSGQENALKEGSGQEREDIDPISVLLEKANAPIGN